MTEIIAISKAGINADGATNPNSFILHSSYNTLKIIATGIFNQVVPSTTAGTYSFSHGLGYTPLVDGFCKVDVRDNAVTNYEGMDIEEFAYKYFFYGIGADGTNVFVGLNNGATVNHTFSVKYYIFEVPF